MPDDSGEPSWTFFKVQLSIKIIVILKQHVICKDKSVLKLKLKDVKAL